MTLGRNVGLTGPVRARIARPYWVRWSNWLGYIPAGYSMQRELPGSSLLLQPLQKGVRKRARPPLIATLQKHDISCLAFRLLDSRVL